MIIPLCKDQVKITVIQFMCSGRSVNGRLAGRFERCWTPIYP